MKETPELERKFHENIAQWLSQNWAELLPDRETRGFFIPSFMVIRIDRASTKYGLILNGAYEFEGRCLNDFLRPGPSQMNN